MSTHEIPRNVKGEGRILYIFSSKALIYTAVGGVFGFIINIIVSIFINSWIASMILTAIPAALGYVIATFKVPDLTKFEITKKTGGENIDDVIKRAIQFKLKSKNKIYVYTEGETKDEQSRNNTSNN